jgi:hypothetical protein
MLDLAGYQKFLDGQLADYELPQEKIDQAEADLKSFTKAAVNKTGKW